MRVIFVGIAQGQSAENAVCPRGWATASRPLIYLGKDHRFLVLCPRCETTVVVRSNVKLLRTTQVVSQQGSELKKRGPTPSKITALSSASEHKLPINTPAKHCTPVALINAARHYHPANAGHLWQ